MVNEVTFTANSGEILGIAGIAGSGQKELLEAIAGLEKIEDGKVIYHACDGKGNHTFRLVTRRNQKPGC